MSKKTSANSFSQKVFASSHLRTPFFVSKNFGNITNCLGPLIEDESGNIFYDLRLYSEKPLWGHNLPLIFKCSFIKRADLPKKIISFNSNLKALDPNVSYLVKDIFFSEKDLIPNAIKNFKDLFLYFDEDKVIHYKSGEPSLSTPSEIKLLDFINTILIDGKRVVNIQNEIKSFCNVHENITCCGLNLILKNSTELNDKLREQCIYISEFNILNDSLYLSLPSSFTNKSLNDFLKRLDFILRN